MADDEDDNPWFPLLGDMNPMTMPFGGFRMNRSMIGKGANQMKSALEIIADQGQDALPTFPVEAIAIKVYPAPETSSLIANFFGFGEKPPIRVVCYIPELHAIYPMWKSNSTKDLPEEDRIKYNNKILDMISSGGGLFTIESDAPEASGVGVTAGDKLLVDYKDRKNMSGGRVLKILQHNVANNLPAEWQNPITSQATPVNAKSTFDDGDASPLGDTLNPQVPPNSSLIIPPATYDDELLDPDIPSRYRPFLHPLNGLGLIASAAPLRNTKTGTHFGIDIGWKGNPIYAMADGYVSRSTQPTDPPKYEKKYVSDRHTSYAKGELKTDDKGTYIEELKGMSSACGWICEIIHWDGTSTNKHSVNGQGYNANQENGYGTRYMHMVGPPLVKKGQRVTRGQIIGYVGGTPFFAPHLHVEVVYKGLYSDPSPYMYMDIDAIAMIEYGGLGIDKQPAGTDFGYIRKYGTFGGKRKGYNYRIGKFIIGQQLVWPKNGKINPINKESSKQWYTPVKGNPLTSGATVYQVAQIENSAGGDNSDGKDTENPLTPDISNIPQQERPESEENNQ